MHASEWMKSTFMYVYVCSGKTGECIIYYTVIILFISG